MYIYSFHLLQMLMNASKTMDTAPTTVATQMDLSTVLVQMVGTWEGMGSTVKVKIFLLFLSHWMDFRVRWGNF